MDMRMRVCRPEDPYLEERAPHQTRPVNPQMGDARLQTQTVLDIRTKPPTNLSSRRQYVNKAVLNLAAAARAHGTSAEVKQIVTVRPDTKPYLCEARNLSRIHR